MEVRKYGFKRSFTALFCIAALYAGGVQIAHARPIEAAERLGAAEKAAKLMRNLTLLKHNINTRPEITVHGMAEASPKIEWDDLKYSQVMTEKAIDTVLRGRKPSAAELKQIDEVVYAYGEKIEQRSRWMAPPVRTVTARHPRQRILNLLRGGMPTARLG